MSRSTQPSTAARRSFPRVSGDEPLDAAFNSRPQEFSPRERG